MSEEQFDFDQFAKPDLRKLIDEKRQEYLKKGGMIKRYVPPYHPDNYLVCDIFTPGEGSSMSQLGLKDTMFRKPRPEKKFGSKNSTT